MKKKYIVPQTDTVKVETQTVLAESRFGNPDANKQQVTLTDQEYNGPTDNKIDYWGSTIWSE